MLWKILVGGIVSVLLVTYSAKGDQVPYAKLYSPEPKETKLLANDLITGEVIDEGVLEEIVEDTVSAKTTETPIIQQIQEANTQVAQTITEETQQIFSLSSLDNFNINYPSSWTLDTSTTQSSYIGIKKRLISLNKGDTVITIESRPRVSSGCEVLGDTPTNQPLSKNILNSGISRYDTDSGDYYAPSVSPHFNCEFERIFLISSTIQSPQTYKDIFNEDFVTFYITTKLNGTEFIDEADQIVVNTLRNYDGY